MQRSTRSITTSSFGGCKIPSDLTAAHSHGLLSTYAHVPLRFIIRDALSDAYHLACSVPQGSVLAPRLYTQYMQFLDTLFRMLLLCFHGYADDTQLLKAVSPCSLDDQLDGMKLLENGEVKISDSLFDNKLKLNRDKTEFLVLSSRYNRKFLNLDSIDLGTDIFTKSESARNLGFIIDITLAFEQHILDVTCASHQSPRLL